MVNRPIKVRKAVAFFIQNLTENYINGQSLNITGRLYPKFINQPNIYEAIP